MADHGGALAFIIWRLCLESAKTLHKDGFEYASDRERIAVLSEFVAFAVQVVDRFAHPRIDDSERAALVNSLGQRVADQMQDNLTDLAGPGDYRRPFVDLLNRRFAEYGELTFVDDAPGFDFLRFVGHQILGALSESQTNRWVLDQVMEVAAPELVDQIRRSVINLTA